MHEGGCLCGALRYRIDAEPRDICVCHCTECRGASGAPAVAWATVDADAFTWTKGTPVRYRSAATDTRSFCGTCGTQLVFETTRSTPRETDFTTASLDDPGLIAPADEVWTRSRLAWLPPLPHAAQHTTRRGT